jgi:hypothetical protein
MLNVATKLKVLYMRVSSDNQSEEMQLNAAKRYLEQYNPDEVLILCSWCISNQVTSSQTSATGKIA